MTTALETPKTREAVLYLDKKCWAYSVTYFDGSAESGDIESVGARALADLDEGHSPSPADVQALRDWLDARTYPNISWTFVDSTGAEVGELWPER